MTSLQKPEELLKDIHKKDAPYNLALIPAKASFSGLWVFKEDHTEARVLGRPGQDPAGVPVARRGLSGHQRGRVGLGGQGAASARKAHERLSTRPVKITEGNGETPFSFEKPKWWEMREGVTIPAIPVGKPMEGGKGYVPERNPYFKKFTTRTMRPVIDFDTCVKCTLCWIQCPDSCFDVTPDGLYDANMDSCCGCGVCEAVCPVKDCVTMVREASFDDNASQWEMWREDKPGYMTWMTAQDPGQGARRPLARLPLPGAVRGGDQAGAGDRAASRSRRASPARTPRARSSNQDGGDPSSWQQWRRQAAAGGESTTRRCSSPAARPVAEALTLADLDVVTAYPIRPYDTVMQAIAKKIANGQLVAEYIVAEGEHSQFEIVKHASTVGARVFCGSSGVGWMYAMECLTVTPPLRVPMVCMVGNRALDDPGAFGVEHNDALVVRDLGLDADLGRHRPGDARHHAPRLPDRRGPAGLPAHRDLGRRRVPDAFADHRAGADPGQGRPSSFPPTTAATSCSIPTTRSRWRRRPTRTGSSRSGGRTTRR